MQPEYLSLPLSLESIIVRYQDRKDLAKCSLQQSVMQHLHLLFTTSFGEFPGDINFGCGIWEHDFDNVTNAYKLKELIRLSLMNTIQENEKRLRQVRVEIQLQQEEIEEMKNNTTIKKRIDIIVSAFYQATNDKFNFRDTFFVGPLSY